MSWTVINWNRRVQLVESMWFIRKMKGTIKEYTAWRAATRSTVKVTRSVK